MDLIIDGKTVHVTTLRNPSHLEAVNPVSMGKTRSKQLTAKEFGYSIEAATNENKIVNVQVIINFVLQIAKTDKFCHFFSFFCPQNSKP